VYYQQRDEFSQAVTHFEKALAVIRTAQDRTTEAECLNNLGLAYRELGNLSRAIFYLSAALDLDKRAGDVNSLLIDLENLGTVSLRKGVAENRRQELLQALDAFRTCLLLQDQRESDPLVRFMAHNNMGIILNELKDHEGARLQLSQAMTYLGDEKRARERCHVLNNVGTSFLDQHNIEKAFDSYRLSFEVASKYSFEGALLESSYGLGQCYERKQEYAFALSFYRKAIEALESMRARITSEPFMIGYARNKFGPYERAIDILADEDMARPSTEGLAEMFDLVERAKARAFIEDVNDARVDVVEADMLNLKRRQHAISENISGLTLKLADRSLSRDAEQALKNELELEEEEYVRLISDMKAPRQTQEDRWGKSIQRLDDIQRLLGAQDAVLLEYVLGEQRSYLMVISPTRVKLILVPAREKIEISLRAYLKLVSNRSLDPRAGFQAAERIGRELVPLDRDENFGNAKAIIVVPDGILHYLPFEVLRIRNGAGSKYLVESAAVSYCPSASALALLTSPVRRGKWKKDLLAFGGPEYVRGAETTIREEGIEWTPLAFSKKEILDIARLYSANSVDVLAGNAATEDNVKRWPLNDYRIIHFACHGFLDERYPYRSALALSVTDASEEDGLLQMREIYGLTMNAELVVLSACQTGKGPLERSEGPMGLARPFFFAGARSVIASLWPVNDKASVVFMREFYGRLKGGCPASEALRGAKRKMLSSRWRHPFYWAGYMLQGDPSAAGPMVKERSAF
jgi:CHAT domain-containing protein